MFIHSGDRDFPEIFEAQRMLKILGLYPFDIDGIYGSGTENAIIRLFAPPCFF
ncbi:MAG: peptidoglycan-binding domain-containing protein [Microscillaceae bacterium]|nr:peptidoglycan-binding domain-containing protein [Microscillaceae bacterium]